MSLAATRTALDRCHHYDLAPVDDETQNTDEVPVVPHSEFEELAHGDDEPEGRRPERTARIAALCICAVLLIAGGVALGAWLGGRGQSSGINQLPHPSGATGSTGTANSGTTGTGNSGSGSAATGGAS